MTETDAGWLTALDHELAARGVSSVDRTEALVEAEGFLADAGGRAIEQFGTPAEYAERLASAVQKGRQAAPGQQANGGRAVLVGTGITKSYRGTKAVSGVSLTVAAGDVVALVGPNGAGKSTLLRVLAGLERPDAGHIERHGGVGYVPQDGGLDPYLRPAEHFVLFGTARGLTSGQSKREGDRLAHELGWDDVGSASVAAELSGGTGQKLSVIVAVIGGPPILLLDEPYQGMDAESTRRFWELLWAMSDDGAAVVVSSHDDTLLNRARTIIEMEGNHDPA